MRLEQKDIDKKDKEDNEEKAEAKQEVIIVTENEVINMKLDRILEVLDSIVQK